MMIRANFILNEKGMTIAELKIILSRFPEDATVSSSAASVYVTISYKEEHTFSQPNFSAPTNRIGDR